MPLPFTDLCYLVLELFALVEHKEDAFPYLCTLQKITTNTFPYLGTLRKITRNTFPFLGTLKKGPKKCIFLSLHPTNDHPKLILSVKMVLCCKNMAAILNE